MTRPSVERVAAYMAGLERRAAAPGDGVAGAARGAVREIAGAVGDGAVGGVTC